MCDLQGLRWLPSGSTGASASAYDQAEDSASAEKQQSDSHSVG